MKNLRITVNGKVYDVQVEETASNQVSAAPSQNPEQSIAQPATQDNTSAAKTAGQAVVAPMPGNILDVKVNEGDKVKRGQIIIILEAMKMENEITAPCDGVIEKLNVKKGDTVDPGAVMASIL